MERTAPGLTSTARQIVATYDYHDESGALLYQKVRYVPKDFRIRRSDGNGGWDWSKGKARPVLYRLPELLIAKAQGQTLFVAEGEKDTDRLHSVGLTTTTNVEGASEPGKKPKWQPEYSDQLEGASRVILLPDSDDAGRSHMQAVAASLAGKVADIRIVELPGLPEKGDVSDWLDAGHTAKELLQLVEAAEMYQPDQASDHAPPSDYSNYPESHGYEKDKGAGAGPTPPPELPKLPRTAISIDDLIIEPPEPPFLIDGYMPKDVQALIGTGGTGKSTLDILQNIHLILGRPLWDMPILDPGSVVYITAEDGEDRLKWRLFHIVNQLGLNRSERQKVADNFHIVNLVGSGRKLVAQDREGNLVITSLADQIIEEFLPIAPARVSFDPLVKFGPGERMVNDGEDMVVNAGHRITQNLHCATNFTHHVSKEVARNGIVDHHSGRGGSALGDGVRAAYQLLTITPDLAKNKNYPGVGIYHADVADGRLLALHITKLTDAKRPLEPLILRRNGWLFEPVEMPSQADLESAIHAARQERANSDVKTLITYLKERPFLKPSRNDLESLYEDIGLTRNKVRAAITKGLKVDLTLIEVSLPSAEQKGGKKTYIAVAGDDQ